MQEVADDDDFADLYQSGKDIFKIEKKAIKRNDDDFKRKKMEA